MRKLFFVVIALSLICTSSCNDGDIITVELNFEDTFEACGEIDLLFYKTKDDPAESLSILISNYSVEKLLEVNDNNIFTVDKSAIFNYRTYNNTKLPDKLFCNDVPPADINIVQNEESDSTVKIETILTEDDNDGILAEYEDVDGNDLLINNDIDGDDIPNYLDFDDDGDNIPTKDENPDPNGDGNPDDAQDTDNDGIPDYLDKDDDGDGVLTRDEEKGEQNENPADDVTNGDVGADYLNPDVKDVLPATKYREHTIYQTYVVKLFVTGISFDILSQEELYFGTLSDDELSTTRKEIPPFN